MGSRGTYISSVVTFRRMKTTFTTCPSLGVLLRSADSGGLFQSKGDQPPEVPAPKAGRGRSPRQLASRPEGAGQGWGLSHSVTCAEGGVPGAELPGAQGGGSVLGRGSPPGKVVWEPPDAPTPAASGAPKPRGLGGSICQPEPSWLHSPTGLWAEARGNPSFLHLPHPVYLPTSPNLPRLCPAFTLTRSTGVGLGVKDGVRDRGWGWGEESEAGS